MSRTSLILVGMLSLTMLAGCGAGTGVSSSSNNQTQVTGSSPEGNPPSGGTPSGGTGSGGSGSGGSGSGGSGGSGSGSGGSGSGSGNGSQGTVLTDLDQNPSWTGYGELPSSYSICANCSPSGPSVTWGLQRGVTDPTLKGQSSKFTIGGDKPYSDVLWVNHLIGDLSSVGLPDKDHSLNASLHNFTYDLYFYSDNFDNAQVLEFDINQYLNNQSFIWGHQCRIAGGNEWDTWDNVKQKWVPTGVACNPKTKSWNHLTIQVQRTSDGNLLFQTITLNGDTATLNIKRPPKSAPDWHGVTVNYQMDGNHTQSTYSVYLNQFNFTYW